MECEANFMCLLSLCHRAWKSAKLIYCADGAANRVYNGLSDDERNSFLPHGIAGDMDSIETHVAEYYRFVTRE